MSIDKKTRAEILRLYYAEKWRIGTKAKSRIDGIRFAHHIG